MVMWSRSVARSQLTHTFIGDMSLRNVSHYFCRLHVTNEYALIFLRFFVGSVNKFVGFFFDEYLVFSYSGIFVYHGRSFLVASSPSISLESFTINNVHSVW
jgi:hypothetical protein